MSRRWRCLLFSIALSAASSAQLGAQDARTPVDARRPLPGDGEVSIRTGTGTVRVSGWDRDSVVVTGSRQAAGRFLFEAEGRTVRIGFDVPLAHADLEVFVPRGASVQIRAQNASVAIQGVSGAIDAASVNGPIRVEGAVRELVAESRGGTVDLRMDAAELVHATTMTGDVTFRGLASDLTLVSILGSVDAQTSSPRRVKVESTEGRVRYAGGVAPDGIAEASTHSGDIEILLPPTSSVKCDVASVIGEITSDLPGEPDQSFPGTRILFDVGAGAGRLEVRSFSGDIDIRRAPPGT